MPIQRILRRSPLGLGKGIPLGKGFSKGVPWTFGAGQKIIGCTFSVSNALGAGFLEKVYQNALLIELANAGLQAEKEKQIQVLYKNQIVGDYFADILVNQQVIIETKAVQSLNEIHQAQLLNYLKATNLSLGLLITPTLSS